VDLEEQTFKMATTFTFPGRIPISIPESPWPNSDEGLGGLPLTTLTSRVAFIFKVRRTGTLDAVQIRPGFVSSSQPIRVSLQTVDATTGNPTGTNYGGSLPGVLATPIVDTFHTVPLATPATAVKGDTIAAVFQFDSIAGSLRLLVLNGFLSASLPYTSTSANSGATWTKEIYIACSCFRYNDGTFDTGFFYPCRVNNNLTETTSATSPNEVANRFNLPFTVRTTGFYASFNRIRQDQQITLYQGTTQLESFIQDKDVPGPLGQGHYVIYGYWDTPRILTAGLDYFLSIKPLNASSPNLQWLRYEFDSSSTLAAMPLGTGVCWAERTGGAWTIDTAKRMSGGLLIDQFS